MQQVTLLLIVKVMTLSQKLWRLKRPQKLLQLKLAAHGLKPSKRLPTFVVTEASVSPAAPQKLVVSFAVDPIFRKIDLTVVTQLGEKVVVSISLLQNWMPILQENPRASRDPRVTPKMV